MTSAPLDGRVAVEPRAAGTLYVTAAGLSDTPPAPEKAARRPAAPSVPADAPAPVPVPPADSAAKPQE